MDLGDYEKEIKGEEMQNSTPPASPVDKKGAPSADQHQRTDSLDPLEASLSKHAISSPLSEISDYPSDLSDGNVHSPVSTWEA